MNRLFTASCLSIAYSLAAWGQSDPPSLLDWSLGQVDGSEFRFADEPGANGWCLIFVSTDCPISNRNMPELRRLAESFAEQSIPVRLVYVNVDDSLKVLQEHLQSFEWTGQAIDDRRQQLAKHLSAKRVPEAFVIDRAGEVVYRGQIDDRYEKPGKPPRAHPQHRFLFDALQAVVDGKRPEIAETDAVGCDIYFPKQRSAKKKPSSPP
jgi:hypothetical protein